MSFIYTLDNSKSWCNLLTHKHITNITFHRLISSSNSTSSLWLVSAAASHQFISRIVLSMFGGSVAGFYWDSEGSLDTGWMCCTGLWSGRTAPGA